MSIGHPRAFCHPPIWGFGFSSASLPAKHSNNQRRDSLPADSATKVHWSPQAYRAPLDPIQPSRSLHGWNALLLRAPWPSHPSPTNDRNCEQSPVRTWREPSPPNQLWSGMIPSHGTYPEACPPHHYPELSAQPHQLPTMWGGSNEFESMRISTEWHANSPRLRLPSASMAENRYSGSRIPLRESPNESTVRIVHHHEQPDDRHCN
mmetsp:Transcript_7597/g.13147  ORF Transcript_7597/g.13147 Transcript_7597/m.13147 type:complete len:206 (+) Transcript_7597:185-802(+)